MKKKKIILNLTQHIATAEQIKAGVFELDFESKELLKKLLTFNSINETKCEEMNKRAEEIVKIIQDYKSKSGIKSIETENTEIWCMIGGAPYFMSILEKKLKENGFIPCYAFSKRIVKEKEENGKIVKITEFIHEGFVQC